MNSDLTEKLEFLLMDKDMPPYVLVIVDENYEPVVRSNIEPSMINQTSEEAIIDVLDVAKRVL